MNRAEAMERYSPIALRAGTLPIFEAIFGLVADLATPLGYVQPRPTGDPGFGVGFTNGKLMVASLYVKRPSIPGAAVLAVSQDACESDPRGLQLLEAHRAFGRRHGLIVPNAQKTSNWTSVKLSTVEVALRLMSELQEAMSPSTTNWSGEHSPGQGGTGGQPPEGVDPYVWQQIRQRRGQTSFRRGLLRAYDHCCAISGCDAEDALEAAHITAVSEEETYEVRAGLLLRADLHTLFDLHLLSVNPDSLQVAVGSAVWNSYQELEGRTIAIPQDRTQRPELERLRQHYGLFLARNESASE